MKQKYSPMMMQYLKIKEEHPNDLLFFRLGDFYEMFFDDAILVSKKLEIALTGKNAGAKERVPMCGVPYHSAATYIQRLVDMGYRIAIAEQLSDPSSKGIVERGVVQVITPGTIFDERQLTMKQNNYIAAYYRFEFMTTLAFSDITTGEFKVINIDSNEHELMNHLSLMHVKEIICTSSQQRIFGDILVSICDDERYNERYQKQFLNLSDLKHIKCASILLNYMLETQKRPLTHLQQIEVIENDAFITMDRYTRIALDLTNTSKDQDKYGSLFWLLDQTKTAMGSRLLKQWIERPLIDRNLIEHRLDVVECLNQNFIQRESIREVLKEVYDIERLSSKIAFGNINARDVQWIAASLKIIPELKIQLSSIEDDVLHQYLNKLVDLQHILSLVDQAIVENPPITIKEGGIIKTGFNEQLDELRYIKDNGKAWLTKFEQEEREKTGIKTLKIGYNRVFGYYIEVTKLNAHLIKDEFEYTRKQSLSNAERYITPALKEMESKILSAQDKIIKLEYDLFLEVRKVIQEDVTTLQDIARAIATIDVYVAFSSISQEASYVRPIFNDNQCLEIMDGRHGVIEKVMPRGKYVSNHVLTTKENPILLITGPNMGGKSTYMRQVALSVVMAQIGSFVPATSANMPIFDQIFTRIGASDDLVSGQSTFMVEMVEANNAITYATKNSLILFDEIGRGTATFDGMALAQAMLEHIATKIGCTTLFSTHYHELTVLEEKSLGIKNVHASAIVKNDNLVFTYQVEPGYSNKSYGINVARLASIPESILQRATILLDDLEAMNHHQVIQTNKIEQPIQQISPIEVMLEKIDPNNLSPINALQTIIELKKIMNR